jgi:sulfate/thiosulfate transport system substrate-binding protein
MNTMRALIIGKRSVAFVVSILFVAMLVVGCAGPASGTGSNNPSGGQVKITLGAYTTPREAYREIIPRFQQQWKEQTGQTVVFEESYLGSGAQSRAVVEGFEADIVALSLEADVTRIERAGLITHDWKAKPYGGMVSTSVVSFAVRKGNPQNVQDWDDLAHPGIEVLTPNPRMSGGAMWNILGLYGAATRGYVEGVPADDPAAAQEYLLKVLQNVTVMDQSARESITNYEKGIGDVAITYENEVLVGLLSGDYYELVIPRSTILIENPVALVDTYVDKHGNREAVEAFLDFLFTEEAQMIFARYGLRSPDPEVAASTAEQYPPVEDLFTITYFGGWDAATPAIFGDNGVFTLTLARSQGQKP